MGIQGKGLVRIRDGGRRTRDRRSARAREKPPPFPADSARRQSDPVFGLHGAEPRRLQHRGDDAGGSPSEDGVPRRHIPPLSGHVEWAIMVGYLVYLNKATLFAIPFDLDKLETRGTALPILDDVASNGTLGTAQLSFSRTRNFGVPKKRRGRRFAHGCVARRRGKDAAAAGEAGRLWTSQPVAGWPAAGPGGDGGIGHGHLGLRLATRHHDAPDLYRIATPARSGPRTGGTSCSEPAGAGMSVTRSDGAGKAQPLTQSKNSQHPWSFTPDGKRMAFMESDSKTVIRFVDRADRERRRGAAGRKAGGFPANAGQRDDIPPFSPDGRWLAYASDESGTFQIYVRAFPDKGGKWQISNGGGGYPMWSRTGHDLFFETPDNHIMAAAYTVKGDSFVADKPRMWSEKQIGGSVNGSEERRSRARRQAHRGADARHRGQGSARVAEPRRVPRKLLRRAAAQSAFQQVAGKRSCAIQF